MKKLLVLFAIIPCVLLGQTKIEPNDLNQWNFYGIGSKGIWGNQFYMKEDANSSKGVMIISPKSYDDSVVVKYEIMTLNAPTVCVTILSASNEGKDLKIPADYDGAMGLWTDKVNNYFFAFRNEAHGFTPFLRKYPEQEGKDATMVAAPKNVMTSGQYYHVEVGRKGYKLWLKINGKIVLNVKDSSPLQGGNIAIRLRGTAGEHAACLIKNMEITD